MDFDEFIEMFVILTTLFCLMSIVKGIVNLCIHGLMT